MSDTKPSHQELEADEVDEGVDATADVHDSDDAAEPVEVLGDDEDGADGADADESDDAADAEDLRPPPVDFKQRRIDELTKLLADKDETLRTYIKAHKKAGQEFELFKERMRRDRAEELERAKGRIVEKLFVVGDNLERSLASSGDAEALREGVALVHRQFQQTLVDMGLEHHDPTGEVFDPSTMEAMGMVPVTDPAMDNRVVHTFQVGYRVGDMELRPARVQVGRFTG